jgi:hypothetical protein
LPKKRNQRKDEYFTLLILLSLNMKGGCGIKGVISSQCMCMRTGIKGGGGDMRGGCEIISAD